MKIVNVSGVAREIAHRDAPAAPVAAGDTVEVPDQVGKSLLKQERNWQPAPTTTKARKGQSVKEND